MAIDVSALADYVIENENLLVTKSLFGGRTAELIAAEGTIMTGVKNAEQINVLSTDAIFQDGNGCTRVSSGNTSLTQRKVTVGYIAVVEDLCVKTLNKKYLSKKLAIGSKTNDLPFEQEYTDLKSGIIAEQLEIAIWQGDLTSLNANLNKLDGYIKEIDATGLAVNANQLVYNGIGAIAVDTGITPANVKAIVASMYLSLPASVQGKKDVRVFCGWDIFNKFIAAYTDANLFNFKPDGTAIEIGEVIIPGTNYRLTAVHGLDATNRLFAMRMSNMYAATDMENEEEKWEILPDQFKNFLRFDAEFKYGVNFAFPDEISSFKLV